MMAGRVGSTGAGVGSEVGGAKREEPETVDLRLLSGLPTLNMELKLALPACALVDRDRLLVFF